MLICQYLACICRLPAQPAAGSFCLGRIAWLCAVYSLRSPLPGFCLLFIRLFTRIEPIRNDTPARKMFAALLICKNPSIHMDTRIGRSGGIRTHGIHIPNVARYQLRYTPIFLSSVFYHRAWRASGCHVSCCGGLGAAAVRAGHTKPCAYCLL